MNLPQVFICRLLSYSCHSLACKSDLKVMHSLNLHLNFWSTAILNKHARTSMNAAVTIDSGSLKYSSNLSWSGRLSVGVKFNLILAFFSFIVWGGEKLAHHFGPNDKFSLIVSSRDRKWLRKWFNWIFIHYAKCHLCRLHTRSLLSFLQTGWLSVPSWNATWVLTLSPILCGLFMWTTECH